MGQNKRYLAIESRICPGADVTLLCLACDISIRQPKGQVDINLLEQRAPPTPGDPEIVSRKFSFPIPIQFE